jgi:hypothetical protein
MVRQRCLNLTEKLRAGQQVEEAEGVGAAGALKDTLPASGVLARMHGGWLPDGGLALASFSLPSLPASPDFFKGLGLT